MNTFLRKKTKTKNKKKKKKRKEQKNKIHMSLKYLLDKIINLEDLNH